MSHLLGYNHYKGRIVSVLYWGMHDKLRFKMFFHRVLLIVCSALPCLSQNIVSLDTELGPVHGIEIDHGGIKLNGFFGVPYAEPPARFAKPEPVKPWTDPKICIIPGGLICPQFIPTYMNDILPSTNMSEACLLLDIYVPKISSANIPVVLWSAAENFDFGQRAMNSMTDFAVQTGSISVVIGFRLGLFGFMSTGDSVIPGNYGLWDQKLAIEWVKSNINSFGGDPTRITLAGFSSGASSVGLIATNPQIAGNFNRIMLFGSTGNSPGIIWKDPQTHAKAFAKNVCPTDLVEPITSQDIHTCLISKSVEELVQSFDSYSASNEEDYNFFRKVFGPVVDNDLIKANVDLKHLPSVDVMVFLSENEQFYGIFQDLAPVQSNYNFQITSEIPKEVICNEFVPVISKAYQLGDKKDAFEKMVCDRYTQTTDKTEISRNAVRIMGDFYNHGPLIDLLRHHTTLNSNNKAFLSLFGVRSPLDQVMATVPWVTGSSTADPIMFMTALKGYTVMFPGMIPAEMVAVADTIIAYAANFIKTGDPNDNGNLPSWPRFSPGNEGYLYLAQQSESRTDLYSSRVDFWLKDIPYFLNPTTTSSSTTTTPTTTTKATTTTKTTTTTPPKTTTTTTTTTTSALQNNQPTTLKPISCANIMKVSMVALFLVASSILINYL